MQLHRAALSGISAYAGLYRPAEIQIGKSKHKPPGAYLIAELVEDLSEYVNNRSAQASSNSSHILCDVAAELDTSLHRWQWQNGKGGFLFGSECQTRNDNRRPYYDALEQADEAAARGEIDVSALEALMSAMLAAQLISVAETASIAEPNRGDNSS